MTSSITAATRPGLTLCLLFLLTGGTNGTSCVAQQVTSHQTQQESGVAWREQERKRLNSQLSGLPLDSDKRRELAARESWLRHWQPGRMSKTPSRANTELPIHRAEPILTSPAAKQARQQISEMDDEHRLHRWLKEQTQGSSDRALWQTRLHWLDELARRKQHLDEIERVARHLISELESSETADEDARLLLQYCWYRLARSLAYRELPDVVSVRPIKDQDKLNALLQEAFDRLQQLAGQGRPEFVLLEIRMLRRAGEQGRALERVELYGNRIPNKWFLKKRRDLIRELGWALPANEAAAIFEREFPEDVALEREREANAKR